jgi:uncharacterized RDD family membrane protein YckC
MKHIFCPQCGAECDEAANFCPQCAYDLAHLRCTVSAAICRYPKAPFGKRLLAFLLDCLIASALCVPATILFTIIVLKDSHVHVQGYVDTDFGAASINACGGHSGDGILVAIVVLLSLLPVVYGFVKDGLGKGQSWGKRAMGLMVVNLPANKPCSVGRSCLRTLITALIQCVPVVGWCIEPLMVLATDDGRRLADKGADTQVVEANLFGDMLDSKKI